VAAMSASPYVPCEQPRPDGRGPPVTAEVDQQMRSHPADRVALDLLLAVVLSHDPGDHRDRHGDVLGGHRRLWEVVVEHLLPVPPRGRREVSHLPVVEQVF
jgi:hypothetical protein